MLATLNIQCSFKDGLVVEQLWKYDSSEAEDFTRAVRGVVIEADAQRAAQAWRGTGPVVVAAATPSNVVGLFRNFTAGATELGVAFVDIDSWDCDVAEVIAAELRPRLIVVEVNLNFDCSETIASPA